jgi:GTP pyrophosphokinase
LEDLAFKYLHPAEYEELVAKVQKTREQREEEIERAKEILEQKLAEAGIEAEVQGRPKHLWSIYTKMQREDVDFGDIYDLIALRIIVKTVPDCYHALGVVNELFVPLPGRFYDYIARPKPNMYQSLHQKLIGPTMEPMEIQIRTHEMHRTAEFGIAAHWSYKEGKPDNGEFAKRLDFMRSQLFEWHHEIGSASEFLRQAVEQLFSDQVFVFTPQGDIVDLPVGATPIDFAYRIHTELGNHMVGARISGKIVPLSYRFDTTLLDQRPPFHNGDVVEIVSRPQATPGIDWAHIAKTSYARNKIRAFFRKKNRAELEAHGREIFFKELRQQRLGDGDLSAQHLAARAAELLNYNDVEDMFVAIGNGSVSPITVVNRVKSEMPIERPDALQVGSLHTEQKIEIVAGGVSNVEYRRSRCCLPLPGDDVVGFVTRGRGISLHRRGCGALASLAREEKARLIDVDWKASGHFSTDVVIEAMDRVGLLGDISHLFSGAQVNIESARIGSRRGQTAQLRLTVDVRDVDQLNQLIQSLLAIPDVLNVYRLGQGPMPPRVAS